MNTDVNMIVSKDCCCGCMACAAICPKNAIVTGNDRYGYIIPLLDEGLCIECGLCMRVCPMNQLMTVELKTIN